MCVTKSGTETCAVALWFGAHVGRTDQWKAFNNTTGAGSVSGSPYHVSLAAFDTESIGQRDNQMAANVIPGTIVIGKPGAGRVAVKGWIVILASIPTGNGEDAATSFAAQARKRSIGTVSVLNSSNKRPLRGGYWVVYTGPYNTLAQVSVAASQVHGSGFTSAYIRELIVYKKKA